MDGSDKTILKEARAYSWLVQGHAVFNGPVHEDYNEQHLVITCLCGEELDAYSHTPVVCTQCGREYELETRIILRWTDDFSQLEREKNPLED